MVKKINRVKAQAQQRQVELARCKEKPENTHITHTTQKTSPNKNLPMPMLSQELELTVDTLVVTTVTIAVDLSQP